MKIPPFQFCHKCAFSNGPWTPAEKGGKKDADDDDDDADDRQASSSGGKAKGKGAAPAAPAPPVFDAAAAKGCAASASASPRELCVVSPVSGHEALRSFGCFTEHHFMAARRRPFTQLHT